MSSGATFRLHDERSRQFAIKYVQTAALGLEVVIRKPRRSPEQNRRLHSMLQAIIESGTQLAGRQWDIDDWRRIMLSGYLTARRKMPGVVVEGLEGEFLVIAPSTRDLSTEEMSDMQEYISAWMAERGIIWADEPAAA